MKKDEANVVTVQVPMRGGGSWERDECSKCGHVVHIGTRYCSWCGSRLIRPTDEP